MRAPGESRDVIRAGGVAWHVPGDAVSAVAPWLSRHFPTILADGGRQVWWSTASRVFLADGLVLKERTARTGRSPLRFALRPSGARRAFRLGRSLAARDIPTPRTLAWGTQRRLGLRQRDYLLTEAVADCRQLAEELGRPHTADARRRLLEALGRLPAAFHRHGYSHRDLRDTNILVAPPADTALWVVDLDCVRRWPWITRSRAEGDLWPLVRTLRRAGWLSPEDQAALVAGYNAAAPARLRLAGLPRGLLRRADAEYERWMRRS